ncbi:hypothetical protein THIX_60089 [Thiomonas sp. X19]|nr:hypothetical protein THIX_60089 [Thiomonas sp. X19]
MPSSASAFWFIITITKILPSPRVWGNRTGTQEAQVVMRVCGRLYRGFPSAKSERSGDAD